MSWILLILAGLFEIGFTTCLKLSDTFSKPWPTLGFIVCAGISFWLLMQATRDIPLGTAYAVWTGIGVLGTVIIGIVVFNDPLSPLRLLFLVLLIGAIIGLKAVS
ncbi:quaternary ammonium compound-resistance protein SugE [Methylovorus glucosotrophus]|jgi:quaternary ammonium compound-resistance protein SugE|uniref:DMT family transporter n=1 Tax=Methylovorus glucosotrophus TaxID=266009 RepID=UPI00133166BC|nr:multidrug efflux SMR transporter [Methylovorus glucosotrophus]KAF0844233.1 quaternary ammonium compound-resistance protein SugE [Methylovorus glucosotrophus]